MNKDKTASSANQIIIFEGQLNLIFTPLAPLIPLEVRLLTGLRNLLRVNSCSWIKLRSVQDLPTIALAKVGEINK